MIPVILFSAYSGIGKTTFLREMIPLILKKGIRVGYIKHHHGKFYNQREKDTWIIHKAGVERTLLIAEDIIVTEDLPKPEELDPIRYYVNSYFRDYQIVIIEGFKNNQIYPKVVLLRGVSQQVKKNVLIDKNIIAVISDKLFKAPYPVFKFDEKERVSQFIIDYFSI